MGLFTAKTNGKRSWWSWLHIPELHVPKVYTLMKWLILVAIAVTCALMGFFQSILVSWLYELRSQFIYNLVQLDEDWKLRYLQYTAFNLGLAFSCSFALYVIEPAASGSGIPDVKAYLNGVESPIFNKFFQFKTFIAKVIGSACAVASSLVMGKEGPMLHAGSILAVILGRNKWMQQQMAVAAHWGTYTYNKEIRDLVAIGAACGVTTAFKAPVGGVMFAMEMATRWRKDLTWRCFLACAIALVVVRGSVLVCVNYNQCDNLKWGSLIWFKRDYPTPYGQVWAIVLLAIVGGYLGSLFTSFNTWVCLVRKRWTKFMWARIGEVCAISVFTSIVLFALPVMGECLECDSKDPTNCISGGAEFRTFQGYRCHAPNHYNDLAVLVFNPQGFLIQALFSAHSGTFSMLSLSIYAAIFWFLAAVTYGAFIPSGLFTPSLIFGGCIGRLFAEVLVHMHVADNSDVGMYALLGAAAFLGGLMRMSAAQALILMEMTQSPSQLPFLMLVLVLSKNVGDHFNYSVFDHQMMLKGLAFVGIDEDAQKKHRLAAKDVMSSNKPTTTLHLVETSERLSMLLDEQRDAAAFPVTKVPIMKDGTLGPETKGEFVGMISRKNISALLEQHGQGSDKIDLSSKVEIAPVIIPPNMPLPFIYRFIAPVIIPPNMPLPFIYRIVNSEGFNYLPVIRYHGPLEGVISREDLVDVQNKKLDEFHLKDQMERMETDIEKGRIIRSMHLTDNPHAIRFKEGAQRFKDFFHNPIKATKEFVQEGQLPEEDQSEFFISEIQTNSTSMASGPGTATDAGAAHPNGDAMHADGMPEDSSNGYSHGEPGPAQWSYADMHGDDAADSGAVGSGATATAWGGQSSDGHAGSYTFSGWAGSSSPLVSLRPEAASETTPLVGSRAESAPADGVADHGPATDESTPLTRGQDRSSDQ